MINLNDNLWGAGERTSCDIDKKLVLLSLVVVLPKYMAYIKRNISIGKIFASLEK